MCYSVRNMKKFHLRKHAQNKAPKHCSGIIRIASKGIGFVEIEGIKNDILIESENLNTALNKDAVQIEILSKQKSSRVTGKVLKIIKRAKECFSGIIEKDKGNFFLVPDDKKVYKDIFVNGNRSNLEKAVGMKVLLKINNWADPKKNPEGQIIQVIGKPGENDVEMKSIALEKGFDPSFSEAVEIEAEKIAKAAEKISPTEISKRRDFRNTLTFTIDPVDAKDFDDAISFKALPNNSFEIGVHIADVSHFVKEKTELDREARKRGFSVYLVDRTIPMLPEALSNNICSLKPNEDRLAFSSVFKINNEGKVLERWFGKTIIRSAKRFTYESAQEILNGKSREHGEELLTLNAIAKKCAR